MRLFRSDELLGIARETMEFVLGLIANRICLNIPMVHLNQQGQKGPPHGIWIDRRPGREPAGGTVGRSPFS